ncbi:MAG: hypothetical protein PHY16_17035 [Methylobacter sp.]|nr:hypothetical protein [Methylobacter sp.]
MRFAKKSGSLYDTKQRLNNVEDTFINSLYVKVASLLPCVLNGRANELGKESGFIIRQRKLTGSNFIKTLLLGWLQTTDPSVDCKGQLKPDTFLSSLPIEFPFKFQRGLIA